jgi:hypothetical protein
MNIMIRSKNYSAFFVRQAENKNLWQKNCEQGSRRAADGRIHGALMAKPKVSKAPKTFWSIKDSCIIVNSPKMPKSAKYRVLASVIIGMAAAGFATMVLFRPQLFGITNIYVVYIGTPLLYLIGVVQMFITINVETGAAAIVNNNGIRIRGRDLAWDHIRGITIDSAGSDSSSNPALLLHTVDQRGNQKMITIISPGMVQEDELLPLWRRIDKRIKQFSENSAADRSPTQE